MQEQGFPSERGYNHDGNFYGATFDGGASGLGNLFQITPAGSLRSLYSFTGGAGGAMPFSALVQATDGNFYGTTQQAGPSGLGVVYRLSLGLRPFVKTLPHAGPVGATVQILGTDLTGTTSVSFNGTPAAFTVVTQTLITTTVPAGAASGQIQVKIPGATLSSAGPFRVTE